MLGMSNRSLSNELFVIRNSRVIARRVAERMLEMKTHPATGEALQVIRGGNGNLLPAHRIASRVQGAVQAYPASSEVDALRLITTGTVPGEVALIANLYSEEYVNRTQERSRESLQASGEFLKSQEARFRKEVERMENRIEAFIRENGAFALDQQSSQAVSNVAELEGRLGETRIELSIAEQRLDSIRQRKQSLQDQLASQLSADPSSELASTRTELRTLQSRIDAIRDRNPSLREDGTSARSQELRRLEQRKERLRTRVDSLAREVVTSSVQTGTGSEDAGGGGLTRLNVLREQEDELELRIQTLQAQRQRLLEQLDEYQREVEQLPAQSMALAQLQRERRTTERIYGYVQEKLQEIRLAEESELGYAEIVQEASIPRTPIAPKRGENMMLAVFLGLLLGGSIVVVRKKMDTLLHTPDDVREQGHQVIGVIPSMDSIIESEFDGQEQITVDDRSVRTSLVMLTAPMSALAESYRRIRTNLQFSRPDTDLRAVMVTSVDKGEGKTTTATNLALAMASADKRTVIVDTDLRRPRLHEVLSVPREIGLSDVLFDEDPDFDVFQTDIDNLSVIPANDNIPNPAELLGSARMRMLIDQLRNQFDFVIFDTPPVLLFSDGVALSSHCDGALVVAEANKTDSRALMHTVDSLRDVEADIIGVVLNRYESNSFMQSYGYDYGYAHSYRRLAEYYQGPQQSQSGGSLGQIKQWITNR